MFVFGSGVLIGTPNNVANPTPINFGLIQDATLEDTAQVKELYGQNRRAVAVGAGTISTTLKATSARFSGQALGALYYGVAPAPGQTVYAIGEAHAIPRGDAIHRHDRAAQHGRLASDQGVTFAGTGLPLQRVTTPSATGQYSVIQRPAPIRSRRPTKARSSWSATAIRWPLPGKPSPSRTRSSATQFRSAACSISSIRRTTRPGRSLSSTPFRRSSALAPS